MNWGTSIAVFYCVFVALFLTLVISSAQEEFHLVREDYYAAELNHEDRLTQMRNLQELGSSVDVRYISQAEEIQIRLPENTDLSRGSIWLYRPSDSRQDIHLDLEGQMALAIPAKDMTAGLWRIQTEWTAENGKTYWQEQTMVLP